MAHHVSRITTLIGSAIVSGTVLAAPKPFDADFVAPLPEDEDVVLHYIASCAPPQRLCQELPLNLNGDTRPGGSPIVDMMIGASGAGGVKRFYAGRSDGLFNPPENFGGEGPTSGLKIADLDKDGDLDMVETMRGEGTPESGTNIVYVNRNGTLASLFQDEQALDSAKGDRSSGVVIGDVNGDTWLDVVISNETTGGHDVTAANQTNYLYLNRTTAANDVEFGPAIRLDAVGTEKYTRRMLLIDVEGDGDLDLVATAANTSADEAGIGNLLYVNTGGDPANPLDNPFAAAVPLNADTADDTDVANAIAAGDIDGDGVHDDLVFSTWSRMSGGVAVEATNRYYINNSTAGSINFETTGTFGAGDNHTNVRLADFDNDGRLDLITTVFEGTNVLHRNVGAPAYFDAGFPLVDPFPSPDGSLSRGLDFADLNNDGSLDVVIANRGLLSLRYLNNDQCASGSCLGGLAGPFENFGPTIVSQLSSAVVPPGGAPINIDQGLLSNLNVNDKDNIYPTDFTAFIEPGGAEYSCTDGIASSGLCTTSRITAGAGAADGVIRVSIKVSDGEDSSGAFGSFDLTIGTGSAPTFTTSATLPPANEDAAYTTTITASDNDGNAIVIATSGLLPTWLELVGASATTATLRSTTPPTQGSVGSHSIALRVTDSGGLSTTQTFTLAVTNVNDKPSVTTTTLPNGTQNQAYSTTVTASDEDGTTPTFATPNTSLPTGLALSAAGAISGTPTVSGTFQVVLTATDGTLSSDPVTVPLTIVAAAGTPNAPPVLTAPGAQTATVGTAFSLTVTATDADSGDTLTFAATGLPAGFSDHSGGCHHRYGDSHHRLAVHGDGQRHRQQERTGYWHVPAHGSASARVTAHRPSLRRVRSRARSAWRSI